MPARILGYSRAFSGTSRNWNSTSVATLVKMDKEDVVNGIAVCLRKSEIDKLDKYLGAPLLNRRSKAKVELLARDGSVADR